MNSINIINVLQTEYFHLYQKLYEKKYLIEHRDLSIKQTGKDSYEITWSGKSAEANITFDLDLDINPIINTLLKCEQFSMLFYDKSILQIEYIIESNEIIKQRMQFIKKTNKVMTIEEIEKFEGNYTEVEGSNWFEDLSGIPVFLRVDYDPKNHKDLTHAKSHFVISNLNNCRIPMRGNLSLSKFTELIIHQIYNDYSFDINNKLNHNDEITQNEKTVLHINW